MPNIRPELIALWQLRGADDSRFDERLLPLLDAIQRQGTLRAAAARNDLSYRHAWGMLERGAAFFGQPVVRMQRGRGAWLTPLGEKLLELDRRVSARLAPMLESLSSELRHELDAILDGGHEQPQRIYASHGLGIGQLRELAEQDPRLHLDLQYRGSLDSLRALLAGQCLLAGFHIPTGEPGRRLAPRFQALLDASEHRLILMARRQQGLITASGNPMGLRRIADLGRTGLRFINRQPESGSRLLFDLLREQANLAAADIDGYDNTEFTHLAVAALISAGVADCGFGIRAAAARFGLGFVPLAWEHYFLAVRAADTDREAVRALREIMQGEAFHQRLEALPGYDPAGAGEVWPVQRLSPDWPG